MKSGISTIKLVLYYDGQIVKTIIEENTEKGNKIIFDKIEKWKEKDIKRNTVKFIIDRDE